MNKRILFILFILLSSIHGNKIWEKTLRRKNIDNAESVNQTIDRGYIICGVTGSFDTGECDAYLLKIDKEGKQTW